MSVMLSAHVQTEVEEEEDVGIHPQHPVVFGAGKLRELREESQPPFTAGMEWENGETGANSG